MKASELKVGDRVVLRYVSWMHDIIQERATVMDTTRNEGVYVQSDGDDMLWWCGEVDGILMSNAFDGYPVTREYESSVDLLISLV